jgi:hypothetical protein
MMALKHINSSSNNNNVAFMAKISFCVVASLLENVMLLVEVLLSVCVRRHGHYVHTRAGEESFILGISSACYVLVLGAGREGKDKNLWKRWKHHPIFCVYGTFRRIFFSPFQSFSFTLRVCLSHADFKTWWKL